MTPSSCPTRAAYLSLRYCTILCSQRVLYVLYIHMRTTSTNT
jgi:hypothetical protein